jgi:hypothetical protein
MITINKRFFLSDNCDKNIFYFKHVTSTFEKHKKNNNIFFVDVQ